MSNNQTASSPTIIVKKSKKWVKVRLLVPGHFEGYTRKAGDIVTIQGSKEDVNTNVFEFIEEINDEKLVNELNAQVELEKKLAESKKRKETA
jgi:hypothetical protein